MNVPLHNIFLYSELVIAPVAVGIRHSLPFDGAFCHAVVTFLGHEVGQGKVMPVEAKVKAISEFPIPDGKKQLMCFLGMAGYYRKFCSNFSTIAEPLTNLLGKRINLFGVKDVKNHSTN